MKNLIQLALSVLILVSITLQAQETLPNKHSVNGIIYKNVPIQNNPDISFFTQSIGVTTNVDNCANGIYPTSILFENNPLMVSMVRPLTGNPPDQVFILFSEMDNSLNFTNTSVFNSPGVYPQIDINRTGTNQNLLGILDRTENRLALKSGSENFIVKSTPGNSPSFVFSNDKIFLGVVKNVPPNFYLYKSEDLGDRFVLIDSLDSFSPSPIFGYPMDFEIFKSLNEQHIVILGVNTAAGEVFSGISEDQADNIWIIYSHDFGSIWNAKKIAVDGKANTVLNYHTANFAPLFENFGQVKGTVSNDGVIHITANGYGVVLDSPTGSNIIAASFPVLYWNSVSENWLSVSNIAIDTVKAILNYFPGNNIGQSYPSISVSEDGQIIYIIWTGPQFSAAGSLEVADNGAGVSYYWRDLYHAFSADGGNTWMYGGLLPGMKTTMSESFAQVSPNLESINPNLSRAHFKYIEDQSTGISTFDGVLTDNEIIYGNYDIVITSIDENISTIDFRLEQNYPNPFNPSTVISYQLPVNGEVTIKIYDMLGREVATLVNEEKPAGSYEVEFNASKYASGVYFYQLSATGGAGNFVQTKKMILMK